MAKKQATRKPAPGPVVQPAQTPVVVQDFRIEIRSIDRSRKDLDKWRAAIQAAESIVRPNRKPLYDLYADLMLDDHLTTVVEQRKLALTNTSLVFQRDGKPVESIQEVIDTEHFEAMLEYLIEARLYGHSLIHCDFRGKNTELVPRANVWPQQHLVTRNPSDMEGIDYTLPPYDGYYLAAGKPDSLGLLIVCAPLVLIKRGDLSDWATFNEIFGQPLRKGTYDPAMPGHKEQVEKALEEAGSMAYVVVPDGSNVEFVEANKVGASETYDKLHERMEQGISKVVVGQTMTTEEGSSRAQGEIHERLAGRIAAADRRWALRHLNNRVREMLLAQGYAEAATGNFSFVDEEERITKDKRLSMDVTIHNNVGKIKKKYFQEEYNVEFVNDTDQQEEPEPDPKTPARKARTPKTETLSVPDDFFA